MPREPKHFGRSDNNDMIIEQRESSLEKELLYIRSGESQVACRTFSLSRRHSCIYAVVAKCMKAFRQQPISEIFFACGARQKPHAIIQFHQGCLISCGIRKAGFTLQTFHLFLAQGKFFFDLSLVLQFFVKLGFLNRHGSGKIREPSLKGFFLIL